MASDVGGGVALLAGPHGLPPLTLGPFVPLIPPVTPPLMFPLAPPITLGLAARLLAAPAVPAPLALLLAVAQAGTAAAATASRPAVPAVAGCEVDVAVVCVGVPGAGRARGA